MAVEPRLEQKPDQVVDVGHWLADNEFEYNLPGAKPKRTLVAPDAGFQPFLLGGHRYIFKSPTGRAVQQIWSEVIAYEIARHVGVTVPAAFLAYNRFGRTPGVLIEFFYGYRFEQPVRFVHAIEAFQGAAQPVDFRHGSLRENIALCRAHRVVDWKAWWAKTIAFDALIGNTDRHSENWGFLVAADPALERRFALAPAFDNGTSMGALVRDGDLDRHMLDGPFKRFLERGAHHVAWLRDSERGAQHADLCRQFVDVYGGVDDMAPIFNLSDSAIERIVSWCTRFDFPVPFSEKRAEFVAAQLKARRTAIKAAVGG
jgi:hypothetical protein